MFKQFLILNLIAIISAPFIAHTDACHIAHISLPIGFINLTECINNGMSIRHTLAESESMQWVITIPHGIVVGDGGIVTNDGLIFEDTETYQQDQQNLLGGYRNIADDPSDFFDGRLVVITSPGQENWYHWLLQVLPRLKIIAESGIIYDKIYVSNIPHAWQQESLRIVLAKLNIPLSIILTAQVDSIIQAQELIVPSVPFVPSKGRRVLPAWLTTFIHDCFLSDTHLDAPQKIYVSRSNATIRRVSNEEELAQFLKEKGFAIVHLEKMPIYEQARYFNQASIIIGPHGSGFANLILSKPTTTIIEIDHGLIGEEQRSFYKRMSTLMNCTYYPFYVDEGPEEYLEDDLLVDINAFAQFLDTVILDSIVIPVR